MNPPPQAEPSAAPELVPANSLVRALNLVGDVWTILILKEAFLGAHRFNEFLGRLAIPRQTLTQRLSALADQQILYKRPVKRRMLVQEYHLTPKGLDLYGFILAVWTWHRRWTPDRQFLPAVLLHEPCGMALEPRFVCRACDRPVRRTDVTVQPSGGTTLDPRPPARLSRQNDVALAKAIGSADRDLVAASVVGDRWSNLVVWAIFNGTHNFFALKQELGISSNILSSRLKKLVTLGLIAATPNGRRLEYAVTPQGDDVYPMMASLNTSGGPSDPASQRSAQAIRLAIMG